METFAGDIVESLLLIAQVDTSIELPQILGEKPEPVFMDLAARLSSVHFDVDGGQIGLGMGFYGDKNVDAELLGAIERGNCLSGQEDDVFDFDWSRSVGAAIKTDTINALFYTLWRIGYLNGPVDLDPSALGGDALPIDAESLAIELYFLLPPVLNDCGGKGIIGLEVSDLHAFIVGDLMGLTIDAEVYLDLAVPLYFGAGDDGLTLQVGDFQFFDVEVIEVADAGIDLLDIKSFLETGLEGLLAGFLAGQTLGPFQLPPVDLGEFLPGLEPGTELQVVDLSVTKQDGYVVVGADLE